MKRMYLRIGKKRYSMTDILIGILGLMMMWGMGFFLVCWFMGAIRE